MSLIENSENNDDDGTNNRINFLNSEMNTEALYKQPGLTTRWRRQWLL